MSPIKKSGTIKYFNDVIQTESDVLNGVCFAVDKMETLDSLVQQQSPVKYTSNHSATSLVERILLSVRTP